MSSTSTSLYYGAQVNITSLGIPISGVKHGCDVFFSSAKTPILQTGIPDTFQILDQDGNIPKDSNGNAVQVFYGDSVSIYNVSAGMFWKQTHGYCLMDTDSSASISNFIITPTTSRAGSVEVSPYVGGGSNIYGTPNSFTLVLNDPGQGKTGDFVVLNPFTGQNGQVQAYVVMENENKPAASFVFWSAQGSSFGGSGPIVRSGHRRGDFWKTYQIPILIIAGVVLFWILTRTKRH